MCACTDDKRVGRSADAGKGVSMTKAAHSIRHLVSVAIMDALTKAVFEHAPVLFARKRAFHFPEPWSHAAALR
jgi:hypothetical protein